MEQSSFLVTDGWRGILVFVRVTVKKYDIQIYMNMREMLLAIVTSEEYFC